MSTSPNLILPYIEAAQAQKHVTHNEAIRALDAVTQLSVLDRDLTAPPASPQDGERYIPASGSTGAWAGKDLNIAAWQDGAWAFYAPREGWLCWVADESALLVWTGSAWAAVSTGGGGMTGEQIAAALAGQNVDNLARLGINASADATNRLSLNSAASLFNHAGNGHQLKINKNAAGDTASTLYQVGFSGRAEMGLMGDENFRFKVSPDGSVWFESILIDRATGRVSFPSGYVGRERLTADRTYFVRTDGNDANNGLVDSPSGAFRTIQKAIDVTASLDLDIYNVTIQLGAGVYAERLILKPLLGAGSAIIVGNEAAPDTVVINSSTAGSGVIQIDQSTRWELRGFRLASTVSSQHGLLASNNSTLKFRNLDFGALVGAAYHINCGDGSVIEANGNWSISGGADRHLAAVHGGLIRTAGRTVTLVGAPAFTTAFVYASSVAAIRGHAMTFLGSATGPRYLVDANAVIYTAGGGANYFPGSSPGTASNGLYV